MQKPFVTSLPQHIGEAIRSGESLAGDDYSPDQIRRWFSEEKEAFFEDDAGNGIVDPYYAYMRSLTPRLASDALGSNQGASRSMLVLGPGNGLEVATFLGARTDWNVSFVEASENFRHELSERYPRSTVLPATELGELPVESASQDLVMALSVLHHVPNVSFVMKEFSRVLRPGGYAVIREPCSSMGDWRHPRSATPNERGISRAWFVGKADALGFGLVQPPTPVLFHPLALLVKRLGLGSRMQSPLYFRADLLLSKLSSSFDHYWRDSFWKKLGPSAYFYLLRKNQ